MIHISLGPDPLPPLTGALRQAAIDEAVRRRIPDYLMFSILRCEAIYGAAHVEETCRSFISVPVNAEFRRLCGCEACRAAEH